MRVMVIVKATKNMQSGDGLKPSSVGKRVRFSDGGNKSVIDGPFAETKELIAGFWIWKVASVQEAVDWVRRCPDPMPGEEYTPELRAKEGQLRAEIERQQKH